MSKKQIKTILSLTIAFIALYALGFGLYAAAGFKASASLGALYVSKAGSFPPGVPAAHAPLQERFRGRLDPDWL